MRPDVESAYAHCERIARRHYENFTIGSCLLPRSERRHLAALYAFARGADDIADEPEHAGDRAAALDAWEAALDDALGGRASGPVFVAVAHTLEARGLSDEPLRALLRAFRYDAAFEPFADFTALRAYCANSANPVGRLVLGLFGVTDERALALSDEVCTGLQLANFWQDLSVDLPRGRSYLPIDEVEACEGAGAALSERTGNPGFEELLGLQLERARRFLARGEALAARIPLRAALEVRTFAGGGLRIVGRVEALGSRVLRVRPRLQRGDYVTVLATSVARTAAQPFVGASGGAQRARRKGVA